MALGQVWNGGSVPRPGRGTAPAAPPSDDPPATFGTAPDAAPHSPNRWFRRMRLPLVPQLVLLVLGFSCLAMLAVLSVVANHYLQKVTELIHDNVQVAARHAAHAAVEPMLALDRRSLSAIARATLDQPGTHAVQIYLLDGEILARASASAGTLESAGIEVRQPVVNPTTGLAVGTVMVRADNGAVQQMRRHLLLVCALLFFGILVVVGCASWWAALRVSAPLRELARAVDQLARQDDVTVQAQGIAEIGRLQRGFNRAARALSDQRRLLESQVRAATAELERKNTQLQAANEAKSRLLAAASHDLRQPLHALTLFTETLQSGEVDPARRERAVRVKECVDSLDRLFTGLLDLAKLDTSSVQPVCAPFALDALFDELSRNFRAQAEEAQLRLVVRKTDTWLDTDYVMLSRILNNLVCNALRYTRDGGVLVAARRRGALLRIDVVDTGIGIAEQHRHKVFEEFYQIDASSFRPERGLGLGLATVRRLARLLGANVRLNSRPGHGTCVSVTLPQCAPPGQPGQAAADRHPEPLAAMRADMAARLAHAADAAEPAAGLDGLRVLVIDDESVILEGLSLMLQQGGAQVATALGREPALRHARQNPAPDVVVCDLLLADGDNGLDLLRTLNQLPHWQARPPGRLLVTGETAEYRLREIAAAGTGHPGAGQPGIDVLHKPVPPDVLRQRIAQAGHARRPAGA